MIRDSWIVEWFRKQENEHNNSWVYIMFAKPSLYLFTLLKRTVFMGVFLVIFVEIMTKFDLKTQVIPSTFHSVMGVVIGLLLVFRTNTAYDRWWEARKIFASLHASLIYLRIKAKSANARVEIINKLSKINLLVFEYSSTSTFNEEIIVKNNFIKEYQELTDYFFQEQLPSPVYGSVERKLMDLLDYFSALERIKGTPIPVSYSLHIKLSIFAYLLTLPLGLFFGLGLWVVPLVMLLFFIISGIEIISNEIENPFKGDPNDLPIEDFKNQNEIYIHKDEAGTINKD